MDCFLNIKSTERIEEDALMLCLEPDHNECPLDSTVKYYEPGVGQDETPALGYNPLKLGHECL